MTDTVAVIIVTRNGKALLENCLAALSAQTWKDKFLIIADNGSTDGSQDFVRRSCPEAELLEFQENAGFARPNNRAIGLALAKGAKYFLLLNNDVALLPDALEHLVRCAKANPRAGALAPVQYYADRPGTVLSAGGSVDLKRGLVLHNRTAPDACSETGFVSGAAFFITAEAIRRAGQLHEPYFFYGEDADLSLRIRREGFTLLCCPEAKCLHKAQASSGNSAFRVYHMTRTRLMLESRLASWPEKTYFAAFFLKNTVLGEYRSLRRGETELADALRDGIKDWFHNRLSEKYKNA